jgi:hypothetical protein
MQAAANRAANSKKTNGRVCAECHTDNTLQWRLGPDGQASLCNACGQRFQRRKQALAHIPATTTLKTTTTGTTSRPGSSSSPVTSSSPASSPVPTFSSSHHYGAAALKREPVSPPPQAQPAVAETRRSDIYSLLN